MGLTRGDVFKSGYMNKDDLAHAGGVVAGNIRAVEMEPVRNMDRDEDEDKPVMYVVGHERGLIVNPTNWDILESAYGINTDDWIGKPIEIFFDTSVMYKGKRTGGIRVRVPQAAIQAKIVTLASHDSLLGQEGAARLEKAMKAQELGFADLRTYLGQQFPQQSGLVDAPAMEWPKSWGATIKKWIDSAEIRTAAAAKAANDAAKDDADIPF